MVGTDRRAVRTIRLFGAPGGRVLPKHRIVHEMTYKTDSDFAYVILERRKCL
jgi:hypothetical protein